MYQTTSLIAVLAISLSAFGVPVFAEGDPAVGAKAFGACASCHSLKPGQHLTGPSLDRIVGRKAGMAEGFIRYSPALKNSGVVWSDKTLDAWLQDPQKFIPQNLMVFPGIKDARAREHLIAFLKTPGSKGGAPSAGGMMGGMMGSQQPENLRQLGPENQVTAVRYCKDSYFVTLASGETLPFWEFNLRFKTDSSVNGPEKGKPVLIGAGMRGDRAAVVFPRPGDISKFIKEQCEER